MSNTELDQYFEIIKTMLLNSAVKLNKWREKFMLEVLLLYLIISGRINFFQLGRYSAFSEQRYRQQFSCKFDWLSFNATLAESRISSHVAIAFDPSYISKSGKCTLLQLNHLIYCPIPSWYIRFSFVRKDAGTNRK